MTLPYEVLPTEEAARLLGVEPRKIKQFLKERLLLSARNEAGKRGIVADCIVNGEFGWEALEHLSGTLTLLADGGFSEEETLGWLYRHNDELNQTPMEALRAGRHHKVNAIANTLGF